MKKKPTASPLFSPVHINQLIVANRFVRSATQDYYAGADGSISPVQYQLYRNLARGGVGMIITGFIYILENGKATPGQLGIYDPHLIPALCELTNQVHEEGGVVVAQLVHSGPQTRAKLVNGPIWVPSADKEFPNATVMDSADIRELISAYVGAAKRCVRAGFDGVQLHCAHGYLLSRFLSPRTNRRKDEWGGSAENRARVVVEIIRGIRESAGSEYPLMVKMNGDDGGLEGGLEIEDAGKTAAILEREGLDAIEVSRGFANSPKSPVEKDVDDESKEAYLLRLAAAIKKAVGIPVISVGGYRTLSVMEKAVRAGSCDMVSMSRPFIREPDLVEKFQEGKMRADCISCNKCFNLRGIRCAQLK